jgi:DNA polymerase-3 subunit epsilon
MNKPIVILDLETTGTDIVRDRTIQFAGLRFETDLITASDSKNILINPEMPISPSAMAVHGITDQDVVLQRTFGERAKELFEFLQGADYGGFNHIGFDIPMLSEEFGRHGYTWPEPGTKFLDAMKVFKAKEKRDLPAALMFYCADEHVGAHDAMADIRATQRVILAQMSIYDDLFDVDKYADFCTDKNALDFAGKIVLDENGVAIYGFGKDKGKSVTANPGFGLWMLKNDFPTNTKNIVRALLKSPA